MNQHSRLQAEPAETLIDTPSHAQIRAARAYLGWTALELAEESGVSFSTVRRVEMPGHRAVRDENVAAIREAFSRHGVRFVSYADGSLGIAGRS
ncbi:MAG TPA: helix-turn-helix domain-containing protein [Devosia sp.]|jgi:predicted transcriptional regulator|uniref:helix-turn-helix domain-containing protein n=1 Tax=Devosia sp. TaxID=1871048 RepID=UPI002DDD5519|nr:helix-turn-helix domain-containing protein [Devosia sp.]HEV2514100.1 helix-turn-helix domain-containing protein [Devosia sp.]